MNKFDVTIYIGNWNTAIYLQVESAHTDVMLVQADMQTLYPTADGINVEAD